MTGYFTDGVGNVGKSNFCCSNVLSFVDADGNVDEGVEMLNEFKIPAR